MFVAIICIAAPLFALSGFVEARLSLAWRVYLVDRLLKMYFDHKSHQWSPFLHETWSHRTFFLLNAHADQVDNPDQRICDDIHSFVAASVLLTMNLSRKIFNCVAFAGASLSLLKETKKRMVD